MITSLMLVKSGLIKAQVIGLFFYIYIKVPMDFNISKSKLPYCIINKIEKFKKSLEYDYKYSVD